MRYFITLSYLGTHYSGWQRQTNAVSIQETIESALSALLKQKTNLIGCGRTDAGVHAYNYVAHFNGTVKIQKPTDFLYKINRMIPADIRIHTLQELNQSLHAQHSALSRTYRYYFHLKPDPFLDKLSTRVYTSRLNIENISKALKLLLEKQDYKAFCKQPLQYPNTICNVNTVKFCSNKTHDRYYFEFKANRFLRSMVRIIVYRLLLIGSEKMSLDTFEDFFLSQKMLDSNSFAYPQGLVLYALDYKDIDFKKPTSYLMDRAIDWNELKIT